MSLSSIKFDRENNPPKYNIKFNSRHIIKKPDTNLTIDDLRWVFSLISWKLIPIGCDYYSILNNKGERTEFEFKPQHNGDIEMRLFSAERVFGSNYCGNIYLSLKKAVISISGGNTLFFSIGDSGCFIMFSNHDKHYTEAEKYISELPKDYRMIMKCSKCGTYMTETSIVPGVYFVLNWMVSLAVAFSAPRCKKCNYKTYSDINFGYETFIQRVSTKRPVTKKLLEKKYKTELNKIRELNNLSK